jgi:hypothetical protein
MCLRRRISGRISGEHTASIFFALAFGGWKSYSSTFGVNFSRWRSAAGFSRWRSAAGKATARHSASIFALAYGGKIFVADLAGRATMHNEYTDGYRQKLQR